MTMLRKITATFIAITLLLTMTTTVFADNTNSMITDKIRVLCLIQDNTNIERDKCQVNQASLSSYNNSKATDLSNYDMMIISSSELDEIAAQQKTTQLIDNGMVLFINDRNIESDALAKKLSLPFEGKDYVKGGTKIGIAVCRINNTYCFINLSSEQATLDANGSETKTKELSIPDNVSITSTCDDSIANIMSFKNEIFNDLVELSSKKINSESLCLQTLPSGYKYVTYGNRNIVSYNTIIGFQHITQYVFIKGSAVVDGKKQVIFDITSKLTSGANDGYYVTYHKNRLHCNVTDEDCFDETYISSNYNSSQSLSLSGSQSGISVSGSTSWSTSPDSQNVTDYFPTADYREWRCTPTSARDAHTYPIEPGIRGINKNATDHKSGGFSGIWQAKLSDGILIFTTTSAYEIGKWW